MAADRKNILLITSDQQHWNTLGCLNPAVKTPNLDRLVAQGTMYDRAYCPNPTCTPTRASIITGQYPSQHGAWSLGTKLPESARTIGQDLSAAGYKTALVGKAHFQQTKSTEEFPSLESYPTLQDLDFWRNFDQPFYGFDHVELARNHTDEFLVGQHYAIWMEEKGLKNWRDYYQKPTGNVEKGGQRHKWPIPEEYHYSTWIAERTNALLDLYAKEDENFFLWSSFFDPHPSYLVPEPWDTMYDPAEIDAPDALEGEHEDSPIHIQMTQQEGADFSPWKESQWNNHGMMYHRYRRKNLAKDIAVYYGMISLMDKYIGKIMDKLDELGLAENTLVVFSTDHGHYFGQHGLTAKGPFHYEDGVRVPYIVRMPGTVPAGRRSDALQTLVDLGPSFLRVAGLDVPNVMTGVDQTPVWYGDRDSARDHVIVEHHHQPTSIHMKTYIDDRYKLTVYFNQEYGELYDLKEDPGEIRNLWARSEHKELKAELMLKLLYAEMGKEPLWMPRVAIA